jgi:hypothetical protein
MGSVGRSLLAILIVAGIVGLIAFARGAPEHGEPNQAPAAAIAVLAG